MSYFIFFMAFVLKSTLSDMIIATLLSCHSHLHEISFPYLHFQFIWVLCPKMCLLQAAYCRLLVLFCFVLFSNQVFYSLSFDWNIQYTDTFKVIIDKYLLIAILNVVFQLILCSSFVSFILCLEDFHLFYAYVLFFLVFMTIFFVLIYGCPVFQVF